MGQKSASLCQVSQSTYWESRYTQGLTGWDMGKVSPPLEAYINQLTNLDLKILVAGAGNAHEVAYLYKQAFHQVWLLDFAQFPLSEFAKKYPSFPRSQLLCMDFFELDSGCYQFDLIFEQTFFCAIDPSRRDEYVKKMYDLLSKGGKLVGVLFAKDFGKDEPPFGGSLAEYEKRLSPYFHLEVLEPCYNSHPARAGNELFMILSKKDGIDTDGFD